MEVVQFHGGLWKVEVIAIWSFFLDFKEAMLKNPTIKHVNMDTLKISRTFVIEIECQNAR